MDVSELDAAVSTAVEAAWSSNTLSTRNSQWKRYFKFCTDTSQCPLPAEIQTVVRFMVFLARDCKYSTVNNYLSAVISLHKFYGYSVSFRDSYLVKLVMKGLKSQLGDQRVQMQPLTVDQLRNMYATAVLTPDDVTIWGAVIPSFRSLLRKSNIVPDGETNLRHVLRRRDVELQEWGVMIRVHSSKALQFKQYVLEIPIYYDSHPIFCVASALQRHFEEVPGLLEDPLFLKQKQGKRVPVLYKELLAFLKRVVASIGLPSSDYGSHSLRRSGAGFLHSIGVPLEDIMAIGDWRSLAVLDYLITPSNRKRDIQEMDVTSKHFSL